MTGPHNNSRHQQEDADDELWLNLSLSLSLGSSNLPPPPPMENEHIRELNLPEPEHQVRVIQDDQHQLLQLEGGGRPPRGRGRKSARSRRWTESIEPPYPWATSRRAVVYGLDELLSKNIKKVSGEVACRNCKQKYKIEYDLESKFSEVRGFVKKNRRNMHDRAPKRWTCPTPLNCELCACEKCVTPLIGKKRNTNWLFLLLGEMIGYCNLPYLKYFCKHSRIHRTGAKDRLLYLTYFALCNQLDPHICF